jgi:hypothetical protein
VQKFDLGYIVPPDDPIQLKQALEAFTRNRHSKIQNLSSLEEAKDVFDLSRATADLICQAKKIIHRVSPVGLP